MTMLQNTFLVVLLVAIASAIPPNPISWFFGKNGLKMNHTGGNEVAIQHFGAMMDQQEDFYTLGRIPYTHLVASSPPENFNIQSGEYTVSQPGLYQVNWSGVKPRGLFEATVGLYKRSPVPDVENVNGTSGQRIGRAFGDDRSRAMNIESIVTLCTGDKVFAVLEAGGLTGQKGYTSFHGRLLNSSPTEVAKCDVAPLKMKL